MPVIEGEVVVTGVLVLPGVLGLEEAGVPVVVVSPGVGVLPGVVVDHGSS